MTSAADLDPIATTHTPTRWAGQRLRNILRINATTSFIAGLAAFLAPGTLDRLLGTGQPGWVRLVGLGLALFALDVVVVAGARASRLARWSPAIIAADGAWVAASATTIAAGWFAPAGAVAVATTAGIVGSFACLQWRRLAGLRHGSLDAIDESPPIEITRASAAVDGPADLLWSIVTDHDLYGRLAPNLSRVVATSADGPGLTRTCANRKGREWHETCTLWSDGRRFEVAVDTRDYPYPLAMMGGAWSVQSGRDREPTTVAMQFAFQPRPTLAGRTFAVVMQLAFPLVLRQIIRGLLGAATRARDDAGAGQDVEIGS